MWSSMCVYETLENRVIVVGLMKPSLMAKVEKNGENALI